MTSSHLKDLLRLKQRSSTRLLLKKTKKVRKKRGKEEKSKEKREKG